jgi:hypothetical protein
MKKYKFTISTGKKEVLSFVDTNAVAAHALVTNANKNLKGNRGKLSYTYSYVK